MQIDLEVPRELAMELASELRGGSVLHAEPVQADLGDLVDEAFAAGVLAERLPPEPERLSIAIRPVWHAEPIVARVEVELEADGRRDARFRRSFEAGRWSRRAPAVARRLRETGALPEGEAVYSRLVATGPDRGSSVRVPPLQAPAIDEATLDELGVHGLGAGELDPDRPVLVGDRMVADVLEAARTAGVNETGGGVLGRIVRLREPLPGTTTRVVTFLTASLFDDRHAGAPGVFHFSPEALAQAAAIAELRGTGECVLTAFHTHGWGCGECNRREGCPLPECTQVSEDDYRVLESMFPSKASLMPIAGRRLGVEGDGPVLAIHGWRGGRVLPIAWRAFRERGARRGAGLRIV